MLAVRLLANCPRGALSSSPSPQGGSDVLRGIQRARYLRPCYFPLPIFSLGRTEGRVGEDLDMARKPLSTAFGAWTSEFHRGAVYPPVRSLHMGAEASSQQDTW